MTRSTSRRDVVLTALRQAPRPLTIVEIADMLAVADVTVRRHLKTLRETGQVLNVGRRDRLAPESGKRLPSRGRDQYCAVAS